MTDKAHDSRAVANEILRLAEGMDRKLTPMQLIKLVYFAHGWVLALLKRPLVKDRVQAWQYGPVIREVYWAFNKYGRQPIPSPALDEFGLEILEEFDEKEQAILDAVVRGYSHLHAYQLSDITHLPGSPWSVTIKSFGQRAQIPNENIQKYFSDLLSKAHGRAAA